MATITCLPLFYGYKTTIVVPYDERLNTSVPEFYYGSQTTVYIPEKENASAKIRCTVDRWPQTAGIAYYSLNTLFVYIAPLGIMIFCQTRITQKLHIKRKTISIFAINRETEDGGNTRINRRIKSRRVIECEATTSIIRVIAVITAVFFVICLPFVTVRLLWHFDTLIPIWLLKVTQLLIFASTSANFLISLKMTPVIRKIFLSFF